MLFYSSQLHANASEDVIDMTTFYLFEKMHCKALKPIIIKLISGKISLLRTEKL